MGTIEQPLNDSKGCGGVMRIAPVGLIANQPFELGCEIVAITHGHPSGYLAAGFLAELIAQLALGRALGSALDQAAEELRAHRGHRETLAAVELARELADGVDPGPEQIEELGKGWVAEEALAIAIYCALAASGFESALVLAVNHDGDSDSTGAITGNLLGTMLGAEAIPSRWLDRLELCDLIEQVARDLED